MPQVVDLESLVCGGGGGGGCCDGKIVCETTLVGPAGGLKPGEPTLAPPAEAVDVDQPAESFRLPVGEAIDWVDRNAGPFYDRDDSTKGITNPKSHHHPATGAKLHSTSQRYTTKRKAPIIALPNKVRNSEYLGHSSRRHAGNFRIFPKKPSGDPQRGKSAVPESEPTSPKVSCIGRVLSDRDRRRFRKVCRGETSTEPSRASSSVSASSAGGRRRRGFWAGIFGFACCGGQGRRSAFPDNEEPPSSRTTNSTTNSKITPSAAAWDRPRAEAGDAEVAGPAPGLGGMKRFASGRRSASWGGEEEQEAGRETKSGPLPQEPRGEGILGRRSAGSLADLHCDRDWEAAGAGPASA